MQHSLAKRGRGNTQKEPTTVESVLEPGFIRVPRGRVSLPNLPQLTRNRPDLTGEAGEHNNWVIRSHYHGGQYLHRQLEKNVWLRYYISGWHSGRTLPGLTLKAVVLTPDAVVKESTFKNHIKVLQDNLQNYTDMNLIFKAQWFESPGFHLTPNQTDPRAMHAHCVRANPCNIYTDGQPGDLEQHYARVKYPAPLG